MSTLSGTGVRKGCGLSFTLYGHFCKRHFVTATFYISGMVISVGAGLGMGGVFDSDHTHLQFCDHTHFCLVMKYCLL